MLNIFYRHDILKYLHILHNLDDYCMHGCNLMCAVSIVGCIYNHIDSIVGYTIYAITIL